MSGGSDEAPPPMDVDMESESDAEEEQMFDLDQLKEMEEAGVVKVADDGNAQDGEGYDDDDDEGEAMDKEDADEEEEDAIEEMAAAVFKKHTKPVHSVAYCAAKNHAATGGEDDQVYIWNMDGAKGDVDTPIHNLTGHSDTVIAVAYSHDGSLLATGGLEGKVILWDPANNYSEVATLEDLADSVSFLFWHPKAKVLFAGSADGKSVMWSGDGTCLQMFLGHAAEVTCGALVSDLKLLATGSEDQSVKVFSPKTGQMQSQFDNRGKGMHTIPAAGVTAIAAHPKNPDFLLSGYDDGSVALLAISSKRVLSVSQHHGQAVEAISTSPILPYYATCSAGEGTLAIWNADGAALRDSLKQDAGFVNCVFSGEHLYTIDTQGEAKRYQARSLQAAPKIWTGHSDTALCLFVHDDGWLLTGSDDNTLRCFKP